MIYNSGRYNGIVNALADSPYSQRFVDGIFFPGTLQGLQTEDLLSFITTENGVILTTEG